MILAAGGMPPLARCLMEGEPKVRMAAAPALANVIDSMHAAAAAIAAGVVPSLAALLASSSREALFPAAVALYNLSVHAEDRSAVARPGVIPGLVSLLDKAAAAQDDDLLLTALEALGNLCGGSQERSRAAAGTGAVRALTSVQQGSSNAEVRETASSVLQNIGAALEQVPRSRAPSQPAARRPPAPRICAAPGCGATRGLHRCGGCGTVRYCSEACSRVHWREHRAECRRLQAERAAAAEQL